MIEYFSDISARRGGDPYENLANAIILQAVDDYRCALRHRVPTDYPCCGDYRVVKRRCEEFFKSDWFSMLTAIDGEWLVTFLRREYYSGKRFK